MDAYAADLRPLLTASGQEVKDNGKSPVLIEQFVRGLPREFAKQIRTNGNRSTISSCVAFVRDLRSVEATSPMGSSPSAVSGDKPHNITQSKLCFQCGEVGHIAKFCPRKKSGGSSSSGEVQCFACGKKGHVKRNCPDWQVYLKSRQKPGASAGVAKETLSPALCMMSRGGKLPRIYVDICNGGSDSQRVEAVVDTVLDPRGICSAPNWPTS